MDSLIYPEVLLDSGSHDGIKGDVQLYGKGSLFPSLLPPTPHFIHTGRERGHRRQLLQAQGSLKAILLVHGSRTRGTEMPSLSQNTPAAFFPTVVTFQDTILNPHSPFQVPLEFLRFFSTTQPTSSFLLALQRNH